MGKADFLAEPRQRRKVQRSALAASAANGHRWRMNNHG